MEHDEAQGQATWTDQLEAEYARGKLEGIALGISQGTARLFRIDQEDRAQGEEAAFRAGYGAGYFDASPAHCACLSCQIKRQRGEAQAAECFTLASSAREARPSPGDCGSY